MQLFPNGSALVVLLSHIILKNLRRVVFFSFLSLHKAFTDVAILFSQTHYTSVCNTPLKLNTRGRVKENQITISHHALINTMTCSLTGTLPNRLKLQTLVCFH